MKRILGFIIIAFLLFSLSLSIFAAEKYGSEENTVTDHQLQKIVKEIKSKCENQLVILEQDINILKETLKICKNNAGKLNITPENIKKLDKWIFEEMGNLVILKSEKDLAFRWLDKQTRNPGEEILKALRKILQIETDNYDRIMNRLIKDTERLDNILKALKELGSD